jgi:hypothetical protein
MPATKNARGELVPAAAAAAPTVATSSRAPAVSEMKSSVPCSFTVKPSVWSPSTPFTSAMGDTVPVCRYKLNVKASFETRISHL